MDVGRNQLVKDTLKRAKGFLNVLFDRRHLLFCIKLRFTVFFRGPEKLFLLGSVRVEEDLEVDLLRCQLVEQTDVVVKTHQHCIQAGCSAVGMFPLQPLSALHPAF